MTNTDRRIDVFMAKATRFVPEMQALRAIVLGCGMVETFKWRQPCYTAHGSNLLIVSNVKDAATINFFKGALLSDPHGLLIPVGPNSQSAMWMKFRNLAEVEERADIVRAYVTEAMAAQAAGKTVVMKTSHEDAYPVELVEKLADDPVFRAAFEALTPGRRRGYAITIAGAKQAKTRVARIEKYAPAILAGRGLHDR